MITSDSSAKKNVVPVSDVDIEPDFIDKVMLVFE